MKLTEAERRILFDALTLYKKSNGLSRTYNPEDAARASSLESLRSKLKKLLAGEFRLTNCHGLHDHRQVDSRSK